MRRNSLVGPGSPGGASGSLATESPELDYRKCPVCGVDCIGMGDDASCPVCEREYRQAVEFIKFLARELERFTAGDC